MKQIQELLELFKGFQFTDILAFGVLLGVEEQDEFVDYVTEICTAFSKTGRTQRRKLMKLAKQVYKANQELEAPIEERNRKLKTILEKLNTLVKEKKKENE